MSKIKSLFEVIRETFKGFVEHKILKMSAALAYTTVFSMAPLLLVILYSFDFFFSREAIEGALYNETKDFIGENAAAQLQTMVQGLSLSNKSNFAAITGIITLIIGATSVFAEIQDSINTIWGIRPKPTTSGLWLYLKSRLLSFGVIGSLGFILLVSMGFSVVMEYIKNTLFDDLTSINFYLVTILDFTITTIIITFLFGSIFSILPDAKISWRQVRVASFTTALLFMLGKFIISYYISQSNVSSLYGAAGSFVVLMLWVYYSSVILYFGAEFSKCYAVKFASPIEPSEFAEIIQTIKITSETETIQEAEKESIELKTTEKLDSKDQK
ncbi:YihY/virulence factor BrkB family protein [Flavobacterium sp.]|uniref:YihY/virulence factor BrkB family protein n=1 Tax=Flavobacterium sp. TaxID=239 RepID=UPI00262E7CEC|nr:YihY/virulence factor BrkB family protein [Flavobacterium sp.]